MPEAYNPIVRTFCQFRAGLTTSLGVARHDVRPGTPLDALLPIGRRREIWRQLRRQGLRLPALELSERDRLCNLWVVLAVSVAAGSSAFYSQNGYVLLFAIPLALFGVLGESPSSRALPARFEDRGRNGDPCVALRRSQGQRVSMDQERDRPKSPHDCRGECGSSPGGNPARDQVARVVNGSTRRLTRGCSGHSATAASRRARPHHPQLPAGLPPARVRGVATAPIPATPLSSRSRKKGRQRVWRLHGNFSSRQPCPPGSSWLQKGSVRVPRGPGGDPPGFVPAGAPNPERSEVRHDLLE